MFLQLFQLQNSNTKTISICLIVLLSKIDLSSSTICNYYDAYTKRFQSTYCSQTCCVGAYSIDDACCFGWVWWIALISIGFPVLITISIIVLLCFIIHRRKRIEYPGSVINPESIHGPPPPVYTMQHANNYTLPPYNISSEISMESRQQQQYGLGSILEPPSYSSVVKYSTNVNQPITQMKTSEENSTTPNTPPISTPNTTNTNKTT